MSEFLGIDIGGTKIAGVILEEDQRVIAQAETLTPREDYASFLKTLAEFIEALDDGRGLRVGIGMPGALSLEDNRVKNSNIPCVRGQPLHFDLTEKIKRPIKIENDANCFALSEAVDGAAAGADVVFGVILGTGAGAGVVVSQKLLVGPNRIAGEWGHNSLPFASPEAFPGPACYCGKNGCVETFLSGPGLARDHLEQTGSELTAQQITAAAVAGDDQAQKTLDRHGLRLAKSLAGVINILDPDVIVLGGGVSQMDHLYSLVPQKWDDFVYSDTVKTRLLKSQHGPNSGVRGAAWLWK